MPYSRFERFLPLSGILVAILFGVSGYLQKVPSGTQADAVAVLRDHQAQNVIAFVTGALSLVAMGFFAAGLRQALRSAESAESTYSSVAFAGGVMWSGAMAMNCWLLIAISDAADQRDASTVRVLGTVLTYSWVPWVTAMSVLLFGVGLGGLRNAVLPKWWAVVTVVLAVLCLLGPVGAGVYLISPVWFAVTAVILSRRQRTTAPVAAPEHALA